MEKAIAQYKQQNPNILFTVKWLPYLLNPTAPKQGMPRALYFKQKFGSVNPSFMSHLVNAGAQDNIQFNLLKPDVISNTVAAHCLLVETENDPEKQNQVQEVLFSKYFEQGQDVGDLQVLQQVVQETGLTMVLLYTLHNM